jgi:hypothetical protein
MLFGVAGSDWEAWVQGLARCSPDERPIDPQAWRGVACLLRWLDCVGREKGPAFVKGLCQNLKRMTIDIEHSALLQRLLQGKEPLPHPPPLACAYPWYELIESGAGTAFDVQEWPHPEEGGTPRLLINQSAQWRILEKVGAQEWIVTYREDGERFRVWKDPTLGDFRCWRLKKLA